MYIKKLFNFSKKNWKSHFFLRLKLLTQHQTEHAYSNRRENEVCLGAKSCEVTCCRRLTDTMLLSCIVPTNLSSALLSCVPPTRLDKKQERNKQPFIFFFFLGSGMESYSAADTQIMTESREFSLI